MVEIINGDIGDFSLGDVIDRTTGDRGIVFITPSLQLYQRARKFFGYSYDFNYFLLIF